jgi:hypothetical protein
VRRLIEVVVVKAQPADARAAADEPGHELEEENARVRLYRIKLDPGDSIPVHTHGAGWVAVTLVGSPGAGTSRWYAAGTPNPLAAGQYPLELLEIEPR